MSKILETLTEREVEFDKTFHGNLNTFIKDFHRQTLIAFLEAQNEEMKSLMEYGTEEYMQGVGDCIDANESLIAELKNI